MAALLDALRCNKGQACPGRLASAGLMAAFLACLVLLDSQGYRATMLQLQEVVVAITRHREAAGGDVAAVGPAAAAPAGTARLLLPAATSSEEPRPYSHVVFTSSHKTGTAQLLCLSRVISEVSGVSLQTSMGNASASDIAAAAAAADASAGRPGLTLSVLPLQQECFSSPAPGGERFRCPQPDVPCDAAGAPLLSLSDCAMHLPVAEGGPTGVVHFVRNPWDVVVSAFWFHTQSPAPEAWLEKEFWTREALMRRDGVPPAALAALGLGQQHSSMSYADVLRSLPEELGVQLEFWRSAPGLYAMARQYAALRHHSAAQQHRFEDAKREFNATVRRMLKEFYPVDAAGILDAAQECDPSTWSREQQARDEHVTAAKHQPGSQERLQAVLVAQPEIRRHLCGLAAALGYEEEEKKRCGGTEGPFQRASRRALAVDR